MIATQHANWIAGRKLSLELAVEKGLFTKSGKGANWLAIPYVEHGQVVNHKYRLTGEKRHMMDPGAPLALWNHDALLDERVTSPDHPAVITEGEWDALAAIQSGFPFAVSVPNGAPKEETALADDGGDAERYRFIWRAQAVLDRVARFILAVDNDGPGVALAADLARRLGPERCMFVRYPEGCKDLGEVLDRHGEDGVANVLRAAKPYPVKGIYRFSDFPDRPPLTGRSLGLPARDDCIRFVPETLTIWTGFAGGGKTSLLVFILANLIRQGVTVTVGSFETIPRPVLHTKMIEALCRSTMVNIKPKDQQWAEDLLEKHFFILAQTIGDEDDELTLEEILERARVTIVRDGSSLLLLDPWNELEHKRRPDEGEHDYTGRAIRMLKSFARNYGAAVWVVAHPKKPGEWAAKASAPGLYEVSGSAHWANKADYGVVIHRPDKKKPITEMSVTKVRMGLPGYEWSIKLEWRWFTAEYADGGNDDDA